MVMRSPETVVVALLGATFAVVGLLLAQSVMALRAHERMVEATLQDFAAFASERIAGDLDSEFASIFLDQIAAGRTAHYAWLAGEAGADEVPEGRWSVPEGAMAEAA